MKILLLCGSQRPGGGASLYLLKALRDRLGREHETVVIHALESAGDGAAELDLSAFDAVVAAFPLYFDSLPSALVRLMRSAEVSRNAGTERPRVYAIVNCGFYEADQNRVALDMLWKWCEKRGLKRGYGLAVGGGEMARAAPLGHGPSANLGRAIDRLSSDIAQGGEGSDVYVEPNFPRFLYQMAAHMGWRKRAKRNGLKRSDIERA